jgi:hypothetical protein
MSRLNSSLGRRVWRILRAALEKANHRRSNRPQRGYTLKTGGINVDQRCMPRPARLGSTERLLYAATAETGDQGRYLDGPVDWLKSMVRNGSYCIGHELLL